MDELFFLFFLSYFIINIIFFNDIFIEIISEILDNKFSLLIVVFFFAVPKKKTTISKKLKKTQLFNFFTKLIFKITKKC